MYIVLAIVLVYKYIAITIYRHSDILIIGDKEMNNKETDDLKKIGKDLWKLYNEVGLSNTQRLKEKIQELNKYMSFYGGFD